MRHDEWTFAGIQFGYIFGWKESRLSITFTLPPVQVRSICHSQQCPWSDSMTQSYGRIRKRERERHVRRQSVGCTWEDEKNGWISHSWDVYSRSCLESWLTNNSLFQFPSPSLSLGLCVCLGRKQKPTSGNETLSNHSTHTQWVLLTQSSTGFTALSWLKRYISLLSLPHFAYLCEKMRWRWRVVSQKSPPLLFCYKIELTSNPFRPHVGRGIHIELRINSSAVIVVASVLKHKHWRRDTAWDKRVVCLEYFELTTKNTSQMIVSQSIKWQIWLDEHLKKAMKEMRRWIGKAFTVSKQMVSERHAEPTSGVHTCVYCVSAFIIRQKRGSCI